MDDTSDEPASAQNADQISVKSQDSPEPYDIAALMREIQNSNRLQEQLLSRVQVALKVKVPAAENETQSPLADVSEEDWEELSRAGQSLLKAHSLTWNYGEDEKYKEVSGKLDAALKVFLKQFERPTKDLSKMTRAIRNRHQQGQRQPELLIPNPKKGVLKIGWCPPPARLTDNIGESQKQDEFEGAVKSAIEGIRSNWAVSERAKSVVEVINLDYDRSGYPVDIVWRHSKKHLSGIMGRCIVPGDLNADFLAQILHCLTAWPGRDSPLLYSGAGFFHEPALGFVAAVAGPWPNRRGLSCWSAGDSSSLLHIQHHLRVLVLEPKPNHTFLEDDPGRILMCCNRERGTLANSTTKNLCLTESRQSIALNTTLTLKLPVYTLFHLIRSAGDAMRRSSGLGRFSWKATNLRIGIYYKGISIFQLKLYQVFESQHGTWTESIDEIDRVLQIRPTDILDDRKRNELMFDSSLKVSEQYFAILQILRIMREWICDALKDLERQKEIWQSDRGYRLSRKLDESIIESNWEVLVSLQQGFEKILLDRIDRKTEEVKSLRDGLFNATSVLEAQRGTEINQYLFVFTVTTIFYLPVSFVATLFGMHLFDSESLHRTRTSFYVSTVLISVVTYVLSGFAAWWVGNSERRQRLKRYWKSLRAESASETNSETKQASTGKESTPVLAEEKSKSKTLWSGLRSRKHKDNDEEFQLPDLGELNVSTRESHSSSPDLARPTTQ